MTQRANDAPPNEGARLLAARVRDAGSQGKVADEAGINRVYLSRYLSGERTPGLAHALALETIGIPAGSWLQEPAGEEPHDAAPDAAPDAPPTGEVAA
jgi:transcriptional regulator with XRE-family HTH domain